MEKTDIIPEWKVREACAKCTESEKHARYFNEAPAGAKQYIALVFFETVFPDDLTEEVADQCFTETLQGLNADDLLYLIAHEKDPRTRDVFVERLAFLREESSRRRRRAEREPPSRKQPPSPAATLSIHAGQRTSVPARPSPERRVAVPENPPSDGHGATPVNPPPSDHAADPGYPFACYARRLDRSVAAWNRTWKLVVASIILIFIAALVYSLVIYAISNGWLRVRRWKW